MSKRYNIHGSSARMMSTLVLHRKAASWILVVLQGTCLLDHGISCIFECAVSAIPHILGTKFPAYRVLFLAVVVNFQQILMPKNLGLVRASIR